MLLLAWLILSSPSHASYEIIARKTETYVPTVDSCDDTKACGLVKVSLNALTKEINVLQELYYSTDARVSYETKPGVSVEDYVFVQMIRGCIYSQSQNRSTGEIVRTFDVGREYWGGSQVFRHPEWVIDNTDASPFYTSFGEHGPYALLRWNANPNRQDPDNDPYYAGSKPPHRTVYMTDFPGPAYAFEAFNGDKAQRISSLQFRTCLLHKDFVNPQSPADGSGVQFDKAVKCFEWSSNFRFNATTKRFEIAQELDPYCLNG